MGRKVAFGTIVIPPRSVELVNQALQSGRVSCGKMVQEFEERFAEIVGVKHAVAVATGTDAVALALATLYDYGASRGDEIILPALSFVATGNAVLQAGFTPVFVDVLPDTLNIDPSKIEAAIRPKTKAILPVHLMGKPANMSAIREISDKHWLDVIEDAAEAHGAQYKGRSAGALADMGCFSTYIAHIITSIEGGLVTTNSDALAGILRSLRSHGRSCNCAVCVVNTGDKDCQKRFANKELGDRRFLFDRIGFSCKMNELEAAIGLGNLDNYDEILACRRSNLRALLAAAPRLAPYLTTIQEEQWESIGPHAFPLLVGKGAGFTRDKVMAYLTEHGIDSRSLFCSMPTQCKGFQFLGYKQGDFPVAEYVGTHGLHIGVHHGLTRDDTDYIMETLCGFLKENT